MKHLHHMVGLVLFAAALSMTPAIVCAADAAVDVPNAAAGADESGPGFMILALLVAAMGAALILATAVLGLAAILLGLGMVYTSVLAALIRRRPGAGVRVFILELGAVAGLAGGVVLSAAIAHSFDVGFGMMWSAIVGAAAGCGAGIGGAFLLNLAWSRAGRWVLARWAAGPLRPPV
jgi:hypothetical protein